MKSLYKLAHYNFKKTFQQLYLIINYETGIVTILSLISTYLCIKFNLLADFPFTVIATAIIFPIVFSIGGAYKRRENALREYGHLKAYGRAIFFASRDWVDKTDKKMQSDLVKLLKQLFDRCSNLFHQPVDQMQPQEQQVYDTFSDLSLYIKSLRKRGLASGEASRSNQYLSKMLISFENIKHIYQYRTPKTLRTYSKVFIFLLPIIYGPYFAYISTEFSPQLTYVIPILFSVVLVSLDNIQDHLENPFDQLGEDDVILNSEKFANNLSRQITSSKSR